MKLTESERRVMEVLWANGTTTAKDLAAALGQRLGWKKTTSYTMIVRCQDKGYLKREEPGFRCTALVTEKQASEWATDELLDTTFRGSADLLVASLVGRKKLSLAQMEKLYESLREMEQEK